MLPKIISFYLPQYHPIPENDDWWGKGFTEWTNVAKAKPLFKGHDQPFLPSDLGFYDLRVPEVREEQAQLAKEAGIYGFAYWHYWFGNGKRILERPLKEVLISKKPDFPFCIAWANESWNGRWHGLDSKILIEQLFPGHQDYIDYFQDCLPYFQDDRYIKVKDKLLFLIYRPLLIPDANKFIDLWRELGLRQGIEFYFVGIGSEECIKSGFDAFVNTGPIIPDKVRFKTLFEKGIYLLTGQSLKQLINSRTPEVYQYENVVKSVLNRPLHKQEFPLVIPNWDNTPRAGIKGLVLQNSSPDLYGKYLSKAINLVSVKEQKIVFIKSWNEWAEGNTLEPSQIWGSAYLETTKKIISENSHE
ncbi:MAG: glycoside hydrolase family 99-like domain-containing protein [Prolixibacteraceae bacterium]|jgi:hypothetical protein|nr:glycoside hydrolase family 99-like domain-containing protein [Prolixibacteraceae bacterium]